MKNLVFDSKLLFMLLWPKNRREGQTQLHNTFFLFFFSLFISLFIFYKWCLVSCLGQLWLTHNNKKKKRILFNFYNINFYIFVFLLLYLVCAANKGKERKRASKYENGRDKETSVQMTQHNGFRVSALFPI